MAEQTQLKAASTNAIRPLQYILKEVEDAVQRERIESGDSYQKIKDLRWKFDQVSATMNQAIYNDQDDQIHEACLKTVAVLIEILARS